GGEDALVKTHLIEIYDLHIDFSATPAAGAFPLTVTFAADMPDNVTGVQWHFGDGAFSSDRTPSHVYEIAGEYSPQLTAYANGTSLTIAKTNYINVKGRNISGRVTGSDNGSGLAGYQVKVIQGQSNQQVGETYTDDNGYYSFICEPSADNCLTVLNEIPAASDLILAVWPPVMQNDYYMQYYNGQSLSSRANLISTKESNQANVNLILERATTHQIKGRVHDNGTAMDNTQVSAYSEKLTFGLNTLTDENGYYTLSGLKASDDYRIYIWDDQQNTEIYYAIPGGNPGIVIPTYSVYSWDAATLIDPTGVLENIDIVLDHRTNQRGTIKGQVQTDSQLPAENIWVYAYSDALETGNGAFTDALGNYTITALNETSDNDPYTMGYIVAVHSIQSNNHNEDVSDLWYTYQAYPGVTDKTEA
ncbi:MAG: hypothetical protein OMM_13530, partial [Candidatus Magnetoglobus multicellularis str. Araruama]